MTPQFFCDELSPGQIQNFCWTPSKYNLFY